MAKKKTYNMNRVKPLTNVLFNIMYIILAACAILPFIYVFIISISSKASIAAVGYSFVPTTLPDGIFGSARQLKSL